MTLDDPLDQLIAYVEGQLSPEQRADFERKLAGSTQLRQHLELMKHIDDSLVQAFAAPGFVPVDFTAARAAAAAAQGRTAPAAWRRWAGLVGVAVAASVLLTFAIPMMQRAAQGDPNALTVSVLYDDQVKGGFKPTWACKDDAEFVQTTQKFFGVPLLAQSDDSVQIVGWTYSNASRYGDLGVSRDAQIILARVDGQPVVVLLDKNDVGGPKLDGKAKGRLNVFKTNVGGVGIFEVTPLNKPAAMQKFHLAQQ